MLHFLEHMPSYQVAEDCIGSAVRASRDFVYMRHPWFDSDGELLLMGYKLYWSDWKVHTTHFNMLDFYKAIRRLHVRGRWLIMGHRRISDISHPAIIRASAAGRSGEDGVPRTPRPLAMPCFYDTACLIQSGSVEQFHWARSRLDDDHEVLIEGRGIDVHEVRTA